MEMQRIDHRLQHSARFLTTFLVLGAGLIVVGFLANIGAWREVLAPTAQNSPLVSKNDLWKSVRGLGRLQPNGGVINLGGPSGDRIREILVREGDEIEKGSVVASLQSHADRLAAKELAASQLEEAKQRLAAVIANGEAQIHEARIHLRQINEIGAMEIAAQEARINLLREQWDNSVRSLKRFKSVSTDVAPRHEVERLEQAELQARGELASAQALLAKTRALQEINRLSAEAQIQTLTTTLERSKSEIPIQSLRNSLQVAEEQLQHTLLRAPISGKVLKILVRPGEVVGVHPLLQMGNTRQMEVIAEIYETDIGRVRIGQHATITSPALSTRELHGTVQRIGSMIARNKIFDLDPAADVERRVVEVTIQLDNHEPAARLIHLQVSVAMTPEASDGE